MKTALFMYARFLFWLADIAYGARRLAMSCLYHDVGFRDFRHESKLVRWALFRLMFVAANTGDSLRNRAILAVHPAF